MQILTDREVNIGTKEWDFGIAWFSGVDSTDLNVERSEKRSKRNEGVARPGPNSKLAQTAQSYANPIRVEEKIELTLPSFPINLQKFYILLPTSISTKVPR